MPSTYAGMWAVILFGMVSVAITAMCLGVYIDTLDQCVERLASCVPSSSAVHRLACKLLLSLSLLLGYMALMAWFAASWKGYLSNGMDFNEGFYMAFQTVSTVGLGDVRPHIESAPVCPEVHEWNLSGSCTTLHLR